MWWFIFFLAVLFLAIALVPKPQNKTPSVEDLEIPTAKEGDVVPVIFGTRDIKTPNVVWYGDIKTIPIKVEAGKK